MVGIPMILRILTLTLEPKDPPRFSIDELRLFFNKHLAEYTTLHKGNTAGFIHRYPVIQCKQVKGTLVVLGISQGADLILQITDGITEITLGGSTCTILKRDPVIMDEEFGTTDAIYMYEFLTPLHALNKQNVKKFYDLKGKTGRDVFMQRILTGHLNALAKSIDCELLSAVSCVAKVRFKRERIHHENVMVFMGKFQTNIQIPDYIGIGQLVSQGFGTVKRLIDDPGQD